MQKHCIKSSSNICFEYLFESPQRGDSNKYPKLMFYEEKRIKQGLSYISFCPLRILYMNKFIIMATFLGTNAVAVTKVHYISYFSMKNICCRYSLEPPHGASNEYPQHMFKRKKRYFLIEKKKKFIERYGLFT